MSQFVALCRVGGDFFEFFLCLVLMVVTPLCVTRIGRLLCLLAETPVVCVFAATGVPSLDIQVEKCMPSSEVFGCYPIEVFLLVTMCLLYLQCIYSLYAAHPVRNGAIKTSETEIPDMVVGTGFITLIRHKYGWQGTGCTIRLCKSGGLLGVYQLIVC